MRPGQRDDAIGDVYRRFSFTVGMEIAQVADVSDGVFRCAVSYLTN